MIFKVTIPSISKEFEIEVEDECEIIEKMIVEHAEDMSGISIGDEYIIERIA
ncbi:MAG: hypothetical protein PHI02_06305 [Sulfurovaceae bacterium]|nr:hypothetical protein [Sulfurovaceae bacterium]